MGGSVGSSRQAATMSEVERTCRAQRACGKTPWIAPCSLHVVGSGAPSRYWLDHHFVSSPPFAQKPRECCLHHLYWHHMAALELTIVEIVAGPAQGWGQPAAALVDR